MTLYRLIAPVTALLIMGFGVPVAAQNQSFTDPSAVDISSTEGTVRRPIDSIVVTSQKRAQAVAVQDVGGAITAFSADALESTFAVDLTDLGQVTPNAQLNSSSTFSGFPNFYIRGVGVNGSTRTVDPAVGIFLDGIYIGYGPVSILDTFDVESIEVLRGPQGTLFGRNVVGGAINVTTRRPSNEFEARARITIGSFDRLEVSASVDIPVIQDKLSVRFSAMSRDRDGYYDVVNLDETKSDVNDTIFRPSLLFTPTDNLEVLISGEYTRIRGGSSATQNIINPINPKLAQTLFEFTPSDDKYIIEHDLLGGTEADIWQIVGRIDWTLDVGVITSITGYRDVTFNTSTDFDGTPFPIFHFPDNKEKQHQFSEELRFASTFSDTFEFVAGLYYFDQKYEVGERRRILDTVNTAGLTILDHKNYAVFAEGSYWVTDQWRLILGGRYTSEKKSIQFAPPGTCALDFSSCTGFITESEKWDNFSPKVGIEFRPVDDMLVYATWVKGFRSGTYNARAQRLETLGPAGEETVQSWELGFKADFADGRVRTNFALFYSDYSDIQKVVTSPNDPSGNEQVVLNAADATIWGLEAEIIVVPIDGLTLQASAGYVDASYDRFENLDVNEDGMVTPDEADIARRLKFEKVPEWTLHVAGTYEFPVGNAGDMALRVAYSYTDDYFTDVRNKDYLRQKGFGLLDASITFYDAQDRFRVSFFGKNLTDTEYFDFGTDIGALTTVLWGGTPRTWGLELEVRL